MRQFDPVEPLTIAKNPAVVSSLQDDRNVNDTHYILVIDDYVIFADCEYFTNKSTKISEWLTYQLEMPKKGLPWFIETLEQKFLDLSGGLPFGVYHHKEEIDGEILKVGRAMAAGGDGNPGYYLATLSRTDDIDFAKEMYFTDDLLFKHGYFDQLKVIAQKITTGQL